MADWDSRVLREYLLGRASPSTLDQIETAMLMKPDLHERLRVLESELLDKYLDEQLEAGVRKDFETRLELDPCLRRTMEVVRGLRAHAELQAKPKKSGYSERIALAILACALFVGGLAAYLLLF